MDLIVEGPSNDRSIGSINYDKWIGLEERLRVIEGNVIFNPVRVNEVCLVPNIMVPEEFRVPYFIKYTGLECPNTHLQSYCNKMIEVIHSDKMLVTKVLKSCNQAPG